MDSFGITRTELGMLRWREGDYWLVANERFNVLSQGSTLEEAWQRWASQFTFEMLWHSKKGTTIPPPDPEVLVRWLTKNEQCNLDLDTSFN